MYMCFMVHVAFEMDSEHPRLGRGSRAFQAEDPAQAKMGKPPAGEQFAALIGWLVHRKYGCEEK